MHVTRTVHAVYNYDVDQQAHPRSLLTTLMIVISCAFISIAITYTDHFDQL